MTNNISRIEKIIVNCGSLKEKLGINDEVVKIHDILSKYTNDEEILVASVMQNSISADYSYDKLTADFGVNVADIVASASKYIYHKDISKKWVNENNAFLKKIEVLKPKPLMIVTAYEIHKLESLINNYREDSLATLKNIEVSIGRQLKYYDHFLSVLSHREGEFRKLSPISLADFNYDLANALSDVQAIVRDEIIVKNYMKKIFNMKVKKVKEKVENL